MAADDDLERFRSNRQDEVDSAAQYHAMADAERDPGVARIYRELAAVEEKHATFSEKQLAERGVEPGPRWRARVLRWAARRFGARAITVFTGRSVWFSGGRQLVLGLAAAGITYGIGAALGIVLE